MKIIHTLLVMLFACHVAGQELSQPPNGNNQKAEVSQWIGLVKITITYHSPDVHGPNGVDRRGHIWGELVRYGFFDEGFGPSTAAPWRAGANETTTVNFSHNVMIEGQAIRAGTYGLFLDVEKDGPWVWIFSNLIGWGSYQYDPRHDVLRVTVTPQEAPHTEWLTFGFDDRQPNSAMAYLQWETKRVPFRIQVPNVNELYVDQMRKELLAWPGFNYQNWQSAAQFCAQNKINLDEALVWADKAISEPFRGAAVGQSDFSTLQTKATVLSAMGRESEASAIMDNAMRLPGVSALSMFLYTRSLLTTGKTEKALESALYNRKIHPEEKFWTYLGLARTYTALGNKKEAIRNWEVVIQQVPESQKGRLPVFESELKKLKG